MRKEFIFMANAKKFEELVPEAQWAALCWMNDCFALGRPFTVSEVFRTVERQKALYAQGRTKPGPIVTERDGVTKISEHQLRLAADIYPNCSKDKQADWYRDIAEIGKKYGIEQPYTKGRFIDLPHFTFENAKRKPEPRIPATPQEAMRKLQRQYRIAKTDSAKKRILARIEEIQSKQ